MAIKILEVKKESCPATLLIGKRYNGNVNWGEWWANDWFSVLEKNPCIPFNGDAYIEPVTSPITLNTVHASPGLAVGGGPIPSYFSEMEYIDNEMWYKDGRGYFLVDGKVTIEKVDGQLKLDVDAINSNELSVKLHYLGKVTTAVENIETDSVTSVQKQIINGQLFIIRNGETFSITGMRVK